MRLEHHQRLNHALAVDASVGPKPADAIDQLVRRAGHVQHDPHDRRQTIERALVTPTRNEQHLTVCDTVQPSRYTTPLHILLARPPHPPPLPGRDIGHIGARY